MRILFSIVSVLLLQSSLFSQQLKVDVGYDYLYSQQWDRTIQTYNFSRPFIKNKQPLFMNGACLSISYIFKSSKKIKGGIILSSSYFRSAAKNDNLNNVLNYYFIVPGYIFHYQDTAKYKAFYSDLAFSAVSGGLFRNINGKPFKYDGKRSKAFGIGGGINLKAGYRFCIRKKYYISPFIAIGYTPYFYSPNTEAVVNQTKGLITKNHTGIFTGQIGLTFNLKKQ